MAQFSKIKSGIEFLTLHRKYNYYCRPMSTVAIKKNQELCPTLPERTDAEWTDAKPYEEIPGPRKWPFVFSFFPGGNMHKVDAVNIQRKLQQTYGDIYRIRGSFGSKDAIFIYNADDFEKVMRTEGPYPSRFPLKTMEYYQKEIRKDIYQGHGGLITEEGSMWSDKRSKVNPVLMKPQILGHHLPSLDEVSREFVNRICQVRDSQTLEVPGNFEIDFKKWGLESVSVIALDARLNLLNSENVHPRVAKLFHALQIVMQLSFELDMLPPIWRYYKSKKFKRLMHALDDITNSITPYIDEALQRINENENSSGKSALEQLLKVDKLVAVIMAIDMLAAGAETTASTTISLIYLLAKHQEKQDKLRKEIISVLPEKDSPLTPENTKNLPYLRACIKESLRLNPTISIYSRNTGKDLVLSGYKIPQGTSTMFNFGAISTNETNFKDSEKFLPERWLKQGSDAYPAGRATNPFASKPFGSGPRICVGKRIAEMEIELLILRVIRNYKVSWNYGDMEYTRNLMNYPSSEIKFKFEDI